MEQTDLGEGVEFQGPKEAVYTKCCLAKYISKHLQRDLTSVNAINGSSHQIVNMSEKIGINFHTKNCLTNLINIG